MIWLIIFSFMWLLAGWCKGQADAIQHDAHYRNVQWMQKWKMDGNYPARYSIDNNPHWWYFGLYHTRGFAVERFPFSSTMLVFTTDRWHLMNFIQYRMYDAMATALVYIEICGRWWAILLMLLICAALRYVGFAVTYEKR